MLLRLPTQASRRNSLIAVIPAILLLGLGSGCAPLEWHRTAGGEYNLEQDQSQCTAQARQEVWQRMPLQPAPVPQVVIDQQGRAIPVNNAPQPDAERFFLEQNLLRQCMTEKGYTLQPKTSAE